MAKLKLVANPTFKAKVPIPMAGGEIVEVQMTFKHRTKAALDDWVNSREGKSDSDLFLDMVDGWELDDAFNKENVDLLLENYIGAGLATYKTYLDQLVQARLGN